MAVNENSTAPSQTHPGPVLNAPLQPLEEAYWSKELASFRGFIKERPGANYRDWQPTKWQSLARVSAELVATGRETLRMPTALELGCGSATLLTQLAAGGWKCVGVDCAPSALMLAREAAESLCLSNTPSFLLADFLSPEFKHQIDPADLVFSIGVLEHFDGAAQEEVFEIHCQFSRQWVLIGLPNLESPIFRSFIEWARRAGRLYEEEHFPVSVPSLAVKSGRRLLRSDGCHLFLSRAEYYIEGDPELDAFYARLRELLICQGGERYRNFPRLDLRPDDIPILQSVEANVSDHERLRFGFLNYYLVEAAALHP
ncbi:MULTISPECIES: class I SAM-dependent methyltransferase [Myxococcus]|uniref:class I SAM-dependent methyltransferase n=1 Tax=Myxococcus TaxID=32 RepID=UPI00114368FC|nr:MULTISPECIES: class I SAM-dependent methyltransferase [Myxococcus]NOK00104.1 class I SAM-dependent methyltransferase [Myxococcus xanthus]